MRRVPLPHRPAAALRRGFTLIELAISTSIAGVVAMAIYAFMLETRLSSARLEAEIELVRQAAVAGEWIARDVRAADAVEPVGGALEVIAPGEARVVYAIEGGGLVRRDAAGSALVGKSVAAVSARRLPRGWVVTLELRRALALGREVRLQRDLLVGDRR